MTPPRRGRRLRNRLGLRARVTAAFAVGALALSCVMAGITYFAARQSILAERQATAQHQAFVNASLVERSLRSSRSDLTQLLESVDTLPGSRSVLHTGGQWYATSISVSERTLPRALRATVSGGSAATQRFVASGAPQFAVGVPLPSVKSQYFEVFSLAEVASTLRTLAAALGAAALVTVVGGAALGRWASRRTLRPLAGVTDAAVAIAEGGLGTRVDAGDDADLQALASAFNRMATNLQQRIEREARFTSDVSHELRSPLTTLSASVAVLQAHRDELEPRAQRALSLLDADLDRFRRMVDDLLEISRFDAGSAELALDDVDPVELVRHALAGASPAAGADVPVDVDPRAAALRLRVDKRRFERVVANLVDNAARYAGGVRRVLVLPGRPGGDGRVGSVRVVIEDNGPGIPPSERDRLFERFYRGELAGRRATGDGTGLGLSLVAEHVRLHGGSVWIEDAPGGGARFVVELPLDPEGSGRRAPSDGALGTTGPLAAVVRPPSPEPPRPRGTVAS